MKVFQDQQTLSGHINRSCATCDPQQPVMCEKAKRSLLIQGTYTVSNAIIRSQLLPALSA